MKTITINVPDSLDLNEADFLVFVASKLYESGKLSLGQAAELAGMTKTTFSEILGRYGVSIFNYPEDEITSDVRNA